MTSPRQPAEWAPHTACWLAWPSHAELWLDQLAAARDSFVALARAIADSEALEILVRTADDEQLARNRLGTVDIRYHRIPYGDIWLRDTAPIFVDAGGTVTASRFGFNGWGGKYLFDDDLTVGDAIAAAAGTPIDRHDLVLEGGAIDCDGAGTVLTTRQCLLNPNRNGELSADQYQDALADAVGARALIWLGDGLQNDHTDGHVDTLARFIAAGVVACMEPAGDDDPNAAAMTAILADLAEARDADGRRLTIARLPSPGAITDPDGELMPASYANFYIANGAVVVPTYGTASDDRAVGAIAELFPGRRAVGIEARPILSGGGAFHCITQQQPRTAEE